MKNIVIPVDFSPYSRSATRAGAFLARKTSSQLHLLHIVQGPENWDKMSVRNRQNNPDMETRMVDAAMKLEDFARNSLFEHLKVATHLKTGIAHEQIVNFARVNKADLIVMGAHGAGESRNVFLGSTAQKVLRAAPCPVLSVKVDFEPTSVKNILFPSDFQPNAANALEMISEIAAALNAGIDLAFINTPADFVDSNEIEERMLRTQPAKKGITVNRIVYNDHEKDRGIIEAAKRQGAGMIAMVTRNRRGKPEYSFGITESVLFFSEVPVLSMIIRK